MPTQPTAKSPARRHGRRAASICVATRQILGRDQATEVAGSMVAIAQHFAAGGDEVTLVWVPGPEEIDKEEAKRLQEYYYANYLINLEILENSKEMLPLLWTPEKQSAGLYYYLKENNFDVVFFALEGGLAYYSLIGKETSLFEQKPWLVVVGHGPMAWEAEANRFFLDGLGPVTVAFMEKYCVEMADLFAPVSGAVLDWMKEHEWALPEQVEILPYLLAGEWRLSSPSPSPKTGSQPREIVLLPGPDFRHGTSLFCAAMDRLARDGDSGTRITAFGPFGQILGEHTGGMLLRHARRWPFALQLVPQLGLRDRIEYVRQKSALAVIPDYASGTGHLVAACVDAGIRFVATSVGANSERADEPGDRCFAKPSAGDLAAAIASALDTPVARPADRGRQDKARDAWSALLERLLRSKAPRQSVPAPGDRPMVSVIMVHHDRPEYLLQAVAAVENQTYENLELILVDDGSELAQSHETLDRLEPDFRRRGWQILRRENKYLGAARNAGVKASKGERILFVDDDNALFPHAVEKFVQAMEASGSDICTAFQRVFYEAYIPSDERLGYIHYLAPGGSLDLGFVHDSFGDANAMVRRSVFDKIGYQIEDYGYTAQDWEFFTRATLAGLKLRVIPEPLYWYRSDPGGMYRTSHWYDNRLPILAAFRKHGFEGLEYVYHLVLSSHVGRSEVHGFRENLLFSQSDQPYHKLCTLDPNSREALDLLAQIAASEGRPDTALGLLGDHDPEDFRKLAYGALAMDTPAQTAMRALSSGIFEDFALRPHELQSFALRAKSASDEQPLFYVEHPDRLYLQTDPTGGMTVATMAAGCPAGTVSVSARVELGDATAEPADFLLLIVPPHADAELAASRAGTQPGEGNSGWCTVSWPGSTREIRAELALPCDRPMNIVIAMRSHGTGSRRGLGCFGAMSIRKALGPENLRRPRVGAPEFRQRARVVEDSELQGATLITPHASPLPLVLIDPNGGGIFLRPHERGPVAAVLPYLFPPLAKKIVATVEIAHEEASPFEFAMALSRPGEDPDWSRNISSQVVAFSGWHLVTEKFARKEFSLALESRTRSRLSLNVAVRLPKGSSASPANAYFRRLLLLWED